MKTIVVAAHERGPARNGYDGCHARAGNNGECPGHGTAEWLNGLGEDEAAYAGFKVTSITNGDVRANWLRATQHVVAEDVEIARLSEARQRARRELAQINRRLREIGIAS